jgi:heat-inducible transcriptional repressor
MPAEPPDDLSERERRVLQALVDAHIESGEPVASRALAIGGELGVSSATVRNVLTLLDDRGLVVQPHTSAGRVPTDRGFRYYVDSLLHYTPPPPDLQEQIERAALDAGDIESALREASRVLSKLSRQTSIVFVHAENARVRHVEFVKLRDDALLFIIVSEDGRVQNRLLPWSGDTTPTTAELTAIGQRLSTLLHDKSLAEGQRAVAAWIADARSELRTVEEKLLVASSDSLRGLSQSRGEGLHVEGSARLLDPLVATTAPTDVAMQKRARDLLDLLEEGEKVRAIFDRAVDAPGIRVFIGGENDHQALIDNGLVSALVIPSSGRAVGYVGVIGPRHLDYGRVVPLVDVTAKVLSRLSSGPVTRPRGP